MAKDTVEKRTDFMVLIECKNQFTITFLTLFNSN